ncbi:FtsJ-domain-containing protein [Lichtheimia hyalospora FSU 10163]|nr:FtsJ-domain-containing protein [Lichtheimia hyalospora FSU 10163]
MYTDADPDYRATKTWSGIPPPSSRDFHRVSSRDHRRDRSQQQQQQQRMPTHEAPRSKPVDMRISTDFLQCKPEQRLGIDDLADTIRIKAGSAASALFWDMPELTDQLTHLRERVKDATSEARGKSNPFERINKSIFINRAATKLAALDATFALTRSEGNETFTFADLCGGPGGFTEYLLWRIHSWGSSAYGYGITLKASPQEDQLNWQTDKFHPDVPLNFTKVDGVDGTGDLYQVPNIREFGAIVQQYTRDRGVDLVVADGGFDFTGREMHQEQLARRLILCEIITMLTCLRQGGSFVCKFFDMSQQFTANLVWILYQLFDSICITKPLSSRPANSERYIVCKNLLKQHPTRLIQALSDLNQRFDKDDISSFIPAAIVESDEEFVDYVKMRNLRFASKQIEALEMLVPYIHDPHRPATHDQEGIRRACLREWRLPEQR